MRGYIAAGVMLLGFAAIALAVAGGQFEDLDRTFILSLRTADTHDPVGPHWIETMFLDLTGLGSTTVVTLVTIAAAGYLAMDGKRASALLVLLAVTGGTLLNNLLKLAFDRPRPDLVAHAVEVQTTSFPSGHAMLSAIVYLTLGALLARTQKQRSVRAYIVGTAAALTIFVGASRVYLGVHWPSDVLAGWCAGAAWALLCWEISRRLQRRGQIEKESD